MTVLLKDMLATLDLWLRPAAFTDYCPNGLQVEGKPGIGRIVSGVTACQALLDAAIDSGADAVLVHHGLFWNGDNPVLTGMKKRRIAALLRADVSLLAYHLPLDAHPEFGNNAMLARLLDIAVEGTLDPADPQGVGNYGHFQQPLPIAGLLQRLEQQLGQPPLHIGDPQTTVQRVAWCSGAAQGDIDHAVAVGAEVFITGEVSEPTVHIAREEGIHFIAAGHHATERGGVQALGEKLQAEFGVSHEFIDIPNPV
jgi:dinuclear metal center YbgI/SA1388 family protein